MRALLIAVVVASIGGAPTKGEVAFATDGGIRVVRIDGSKTRPIVARGAGAPAWSNDGRWIAYSRSQSRDSASIWIRRADGGAPRRLTFGGSHGEGPLDLDPSWTPNGREIVFHREVYADIDTLHVDLYIVEVRTGRVRRLTRTPDDWEHTPDWSPDGNSIVVADDRGLSLFDALTGRRVSRLTTAGDDWAPDWSPDGRSIAYHHEGFVAGRLRSTLRFVDVRSRRVRRVSSMNMSDPSWSPDGTWLAVARKSTKLWSIALVSADGENVKTLVSSGTSPAWRP